MTKILVYEFYIIQLENKTFNVNIKDAESLNIIEDFGDSIPQYDNINGLHLKFGQKKFFKTKNSKIEFKYIKYNVMGKWDELTDETI